MYTSICGLYSGVGLMGGGNDVQIELLKYFLKCVWHILISRLRVQAMQNDNVARIRLLSLHHEET